MFLVLGAWAVHSVAFEVCPEDALITARPLRLFYLFAFASHPITVFIHHLQNSYFEGLFLSPRTLPPSGLKPATTSRC